MEMMQRSGRSGCQSAVVAFVIATVVWGVRAVGAEDWPEWRGAGRSAVWQETGIVDGFPDAGLQATWRAPIRSGFAGPAVAGGRVFVLDWQEDPESRTLDGTERLVALDEETGAELWTHEWGTSYRMLQASYAIGPRATPTVDGDRVYVVGATGVLRCLDVETGELIWTRDYIDEYDTSVATWGVSSAPLVDGERLIAIVGGEPDALVVAFDKRTGEELWRALDVVGEMGYGQPVIYEAGGVRQLIVWHPAALASLDPATGEVYWEEPWEVSMGISVATPVRDDNYLLVSQFYNGSLMMRLDTDRPGATMLWKGGSRSEMPGETDGLHALLTTPIISGDQIYGVGSYGELRGLSARTGERLWMSGEMTAQARWGTAYMVRHGERYFVSNDDGYLIIARFTPEGYVELDRTLLLEPTSGPGTGRGVSSIGRSTGRIRPSPTATSCSATTGRWCGSRWTPRTTAEQPRPVGRQRTGRRPAAASERDALRVGRVVGHVALVHAPVVHDRLDVLLSVGAALDRHRVPSHHPRDLVAVGHQRDGRLVDLVLDLQAHARVAGDVLGPELVVRERRPHAVLVGMRVDVELVAAADDADRHRVGDAVPGAGLQHDGVAALRIAEVVDEIPVRHHFLDDFPGQPQSGLGNPVVARELLTSGIQVLRLETSRLQREDREQQDADN